MLLEQLKARLIEIRNQLQAIVTAAESSEAKSLTADQQAQFDKLLAEKETVAANITRLESLQEMSASPGRTTAPARIEVITAAEQDPMRGFRSAADFGKAVHQASLPGGEFDKRLNILGAPTNYHSEGGSADGYMVPPQMRDQIFELISAEENLWSTVNPEPTEANHVQMSKDESTPWGSTGIQAYWGAEAGQFTKSRLATDGALVKLHKLYAYVLASDELLQDAARLNARLTSGAARAISWKRDQAIVEGDGVGKPLGWMQSGAKVSVAKESGQAAATIVAANVLKMFSRLLQYGSQGAYWLINSNTLPQLATMTIGDHPIWTPPLSGLNAAPGGVLLGLPIRYSEHCETLGTAGDIQLIAPRGYYAIEKQGGIDFKSSIHLYFDYDVEAFRWTFRAGGQPFMSAAVSPGKGSATKSHFIVLDTRA